MQNYMQTEAPDAELIDVLIAISVISRQLAAKMQSQTKTETE